jgi:hypothetical protein
MISGKIDDPLNRNKVLLEKLFAPISMYAKESEICPGNFANL